MSILDSINEAFHEKVAKKAAKENLRPLLEETMAALHASKEPFIFCKLNEDDSFVTAMGGDNQANMGKVYSNTLAFIVAALKVEGIKDDAIRASLHDAVDKCIDILNSEDNAPEKFFGLRKVK